MILQNFYHVLEENTPCDTDEHDVHPLTVDAGLPVYQDINEFAVKDSEEAEPSFDTPATVTTTRLNVSSPFLGILDASDQPPLYQDIIELQESIQQTTS